MIGAVIRMIETGGRKKPSTTTMSRIAVSSTQREVAATRSIVPSIG